MAKKTVDKKRQLTKKHTIKKNSLRFISYFYFFLVCLIETIRCDGVSMKTSNKRSQKTVFGGPSSKKTRGRWWEAGVLDADCEVGGVRQMMRKLCVKFVVGRWVQSGKDRRR